MATFFADIPYFDSHLNLSLQRPFSSILKVAVVERFNCVNKFSALSNLVFRSNKTKITPVSFFESLKCKN